MELSDLIVFDKKSILICGAAHVLVVDVSSSHVCTDEWHPTASTLTLAPQESRTGGKPHGPSYA